MENFKVIGKYLPVQFWGFKYEKLRKNVANLGAKI